MEIISLLERHAFSKKNGILNLQINKNILPLLIILKL